MEWLRYGTEHYPNRICINEYSGAVQGTNQVTFNLSNT